MKLQICLIFLFLWECSGLQYVEVFSDKFDGTRANRAVDTTKWTVVDGESILNNEIHHFIPQDIWEEHGYAFIRSNNASLDHPNVDYSSGGLDTRGKFEFMYGEVEWTVKLPPGRGVYATLSLFPKECVFGMPCDHWPPQIDILQFRGDFPTRISCMVHYGQRPHNRHDGIEINGPNFTNEFHKFKVLWDDQQMVFYIDGQERYKIADGSKIPHRPMYLAVSSAIGGWYAGLPDDTTPFPSHFTIDGVTVHRWQ